MLAASVCAALANAAAQAPPPPGLPQIPSPAGLATPAPINAAPPDRTDIRLQFPNAPVTQVLDYYEALTGKRVLADPTVQGQCNIVVNTPVDKADAIKIMEVQLSLNGFALVPVGDKIVKVLGLGKPVRNAGVPIYVDLNDVPDSEVVVSFLARLRYLDAQEVASLLQQYIPPTNTTAFTPLQKSGALLITDSASSVRRLASLVNEIDVPVAPVTAKFIRLERADASKAVEFLNNVFDTKSQNGGGPGGAAPNNPNAIRRPIRRPGDDSQVINDVPAPLTAGGLPLLNGESIIQGRITLTADVRTNRIHVVTSPLNMPLVEALIREYDADTPFARPVRRPLKFVGAKDVLPILVQTLAEPGSDNGNGGGTGGGNQPPTARQPTSNSSSSNLFNNNNSSSGSSDSGSGDSSTIGQSGLDTQPVDTTPTIAVVGTTKIIADQSSNTIILLGGAEAKDKVFQTLDQLDVRPKQVVIRTIIGELSLGKNGELGFNYLLRTNKGSLLTQYNAAALPSSATTSTDTTGTTTTTGATSLSSALNTFSTLAVGTASGFSGVGGILSIGKSFDVILSALESTNRFKTISRPTIMTTNNKKAIIASGQEIAVPTSSVGSVSTTSATSTGVLTNVEFKNVVLQLEVVPLVNSENEVTLDILQKIDSLVAGTGTVVNGNSVPTIATRYLKSTVSARNGETIVLGGLITQDDSKTDSNIPYLSKIPLVGPLFRSRTTSADRSELIILMHPEVVNNPDTLDTIRAGEEDRTYLGSNLEDQILPNRPVKKAQPAYPTPTPGFRK